MVECVQNTRLNCSTVSEPVTLASYFSTANGDMTSPATVGLEYTIWSIVPPTADEIAERVGPWIDFVSDMSTQNVRAMVRDVYAEDAYLNDTLKEVRGIDAIESYFLHSVDATERVTAEILDVAESDRDYYLRWVMVITFKRLNDREPTRSIGMSHLRSNADGKVVYHQDYWDSASGFYQYVPILGRLIKAIKGRL